MSENLAVLEKIPKFKRFKAASHVILDDGRIHGDFIGDNDDFFYKKLTTWLGARPTAISAYDCKNFKWVKDPPVVKKAAPVTRRRTTTTTNRSSGYGGYSGYYSAPR